MSPPTPDVASSPAGHAVPASAADRILLQGPHSRRREIRILMQTVRDFIRGFRTLHFAGPCVTVFGSARFHEDHPYYQLAREVGAGLSRIGFTVMTGGGPGVMEGANRGAKEAGGWSVACNIKLPFEQAANRYLDRWVTCEYFFVRKVLLFKYSYAFIALPGGIGTMDELFEALTLIQTGKVLNFPVVLMGREYWGPLLGQLDLMVKEKTISPEDLDLLLVTDDVEEALAHVRARTIDAFGLVPRKTPHPWAVLGERGRAGVRPPMPEERAGGA